MSLSGAILFQKSVLCFYGVNGAPGHKNRQLVFLILTLLFVFVYKVYELVVIGLYIRQVGRVAPYDDPELFKIGPAVIRAAMLVTPKHSKSNIPPVELDRPDLNMNYKAIEPTAAEATCKEPEDIKHTEINSNQVIDHNQNFQFPFPRTTGFYSPHAHRWEY